MAQLRLLAIIPHDDATVMLHFDRTPTQEEMATLRDAVRSQGSLNTSNAALTTP